MSIVQKYINFPSRDGDSQRGESRFSPFIPSIGFPNAQDIIKKRCMLLLARLSVNFFLLFCCLPCFSSSPILPIEKWETSQGVPVYFVSTPHIPIVDISVILNAGSAYDQNQWGLAQLVANALDEGTKKHNADQLAVAFEKTGAQYSSQTDRDTTVISMRSLSDTEFLQPALQTFTEVIGSASFPEDAFNRVKSQTLSAIQQDQQDPSATAKNAFYKTLYGDQPYGHPVLGTRDTLKAITRTNVENFYKQYYITANAKIIIVGDLQRIDAEKIANNLMSSLPKGKPAPSLTVAKAAAEGSTEAVAFPSQQTTVILGQLGIDRHSNQYFPLLVGNFLLGQMPLGSMLFQQVRNERGLVYSIYSAFPMLTYRGPFAILFKTRSSEKDQAQQITRQVLAQFMINGPAPEQLQLAKQYIINNFPLNLATNEDIEGALQEIAVNNRPLNYLDTFRDNVAAVTADQIKQAFQQTLSPDKMVTVSVGPKTSS